MTLNSSLLRSCYWIYKSCLLCYLYITLRHRGSAHKLAPLFQIVMLTLYIFLNHLIDSELGHADP